MAQVLKTSKERCQTACRRCLLCMDFACLLSFIMQSQIPILLQALPNLGLLQFWSTGLGGTIPQSWFAPGSWQKMRSIVLRNNSAISGGPPNTCLLGRILSGFLCHAIQLHPFARLPDSCTLIRPECLQKAGAAWPPQHSMPRSSPAHSMQ